jgi:hypothetical protein
MRSDAAYGWLLIAGSVILLIVGVIHPSAIPYGDPEALARIGMVDEITHALAILGAWLLLAGQLGLSQMLGMSRAVVTAALVAAALATMGILVAATFDGFVIPRLLDRWTNADASQHSSIEQSVYFCFLVASALTRVYMLLEVIAILLWSWEIRRIGLSKGVPVTGAVIGILGVATLLGGPAIINVHALLATVVVQAVWMIWVGAMLITKNQLQT